MKEEGDAGNIRANKGEILARKACPFAFHWSENLS